MSIAHVIILTGITEDSVFHNTIVHDRHFFNKIYVNVLKEISLNFNSGYTNNLNIKDDTNKLPKFFTEYTVALIVQ